MSAQGIRRLPAQLHVQKGRLGPLAAGCNIQALPFTVFIGPQGTGKSLAAQLLYLFEDLPRLARYAEARLAPSSSGKPWSPGVILKAALDGLRSGDGHFSPFLANGTTIEWQPSGDADSPQPPQSFTVSWSSVGSRRKVSLTANRALQARLAQIRQGSDAEPTRAIFVPTERLLVSELTKPAALQVIGGPSTFVFFAEALDAARQTLDEWTDATPDTAPGRLIRQRGRRELGGEVVRRRNTWKWRVPLADDDEVLLNIDMASSGQKANWPLVLLAETLFSWRKSGLIAAGAALYVEEPEIHLHPKAQRAMIHILAMLVSGGFRVLLTTHSLTVLYTINNLVQASLLPKGTKAKGLPPTGAWLPPEQVSAVLFGTDGGVRSLINRANGFIDEAELGAVSAELQDEMNRISSLLPE